MADPLLAPPAQTMAWTDVPGVVVRQVTQVADMVATALDAPYEKENRYTVSLLPEGRRAAREPYDNTPGVWHPTGEELKALPPLLLGKEKSSLGWRMVMSFLGCLNLRAFKMPFLSGGPGGHELFRLDRPYHCGGCLGDPLRLRLVQGEQVLGQVVEDFRCGPCCCQCTSFARVLGGAGDKHRYTLRTSECCCGRVNNCCGASCCAPSKHFIIDVLSPDEGKLVATIQRVYAPTEGAGACCRATFAFSNYILEFPPHATEEERKLLLAALLHVDYQVFQRKGGNED